MNTAMFPSAAAHIWLIQNKSKTVQSGKSLDEPLRYLPSNVRNETAHETSSNREKVMCPAYGGPRNDGWVPLKRFVKHKSTFLHPELPPAAGVESISCDEFPFASTYQSPGVPVANGGVNTAGPNGGGNVSRPWRRESTTAASTCSTTPATTPRRSTRNAVGRRCP